MHLKTRDIIVWFDPTQQEEPALYRIAHISDGAVILIEDDVVEFDVLPEELILIQEALACEECGNLNVQVQAWVNINTDKFVDDVGDNASKWCDACGKEVSVLAVSEHPIYKPQINKLKQLK